VRRVSKRKRPLSERKIAFLLFSQGRSSSSVRELAYERENPRARVGKKEIHLPIARTGGTGKRDPHLFGVLHPSVSNRSIPKREKGFPLWGGTLDLSSHLIAILEGG